MYSMEIDNDASWVVELSAIVPIVTEPGWAVVVGEASHKVQIMSIYLYLYLYLYLYVYLHCLCICNCIFLFEEQYYSTTVQ